MSWRLLPARTAFAEHARCWDELNARLYASHPLFDSRFFGLLLKHFASDAVRLALYQSESGIEAMLLLEPSDSHNWRLFLPSQAQIAPLLVPPEQLSRCAELFKALPGWAWRLEWLCQDPDYSPTFSETGCIERSEHALTMAVTLDGDFAGYWAGRSKNVRHNIGRYRRRCDENHRIDFAVHQQPDAIAAALTEYGHLESLGWKAASGTAIHPDNAQGRFYAELLQAYAEQDQARVYALSLDGALAASRLCIGNDRMLVILKTTYDETRAEFAPGRLLLQQLLEHEFQQQRYQRIEFYTNATRDQLQWATEQRPIDHISHYRSAGHRRGTELLRRIKRWLRPSGASATPKQNTPHTET